VLCRDADPHRREEVNGEDCPLFIQFWRNSIIDIYRTAMIPDVVVALLLTVVILSCATVYTVDYGAQAAAAVVVAIPLVVLMLIFQRRVVSGLAAGVVKR
jgi:ABC-type maltose transport system permease subunit